MSAPIIAIVNNKLGTSEPSLTYHIAWMLADLGHRVVAADLDPEANLTSAFLDERALEAVWSAAGPRSTVWGAIEPLQEGVGSIGPAPLYPITDMLTLLPGDVALASFEDELAASWLGSADTIARSYRVMSALWAMLQDSVERHEADFVLVDVGSGLGAINRAALVASDHVAIPMAPDQFSIQGLRNLGPALRSWREGWRQRLDARPDGLLELPEGRMNPIGYVLLQQGVHVNRPVGSHERWISQIPAEFHRSVLADGETDLTVRDDPACLGLLKHYHTLGTFAQEARKPMFALTYADGAYGGHLTAARDSYADFKQLALRMVEAAGIQPTPG